MSAEFQEAEDVRGMSLQSFAASALFERIFDEGMGLVEETARYLDGRGRDESKRAPRKVALVYAGESMRVTTRLMQAASWLLIQRAVQEGDMTPDDAASDRYRLGAREICMGKREEDIDGMPREAARTAGQQRKPLQAHLAPGRGVVPRPEVNTGVKTHFDRLQAAFGGRAKAE